MTVSVKHITVIGAVNVDIAGTPSARLVARDSNPGQIRVTYGGVGRNIADNIVRLGLPVEFITVLGDDVHAAAIRKNCRQLKISLKQSLVVSGRNTSSYLCINNEKGDMHVAVNDMGIYDLLTPNFLGPKMDLINRGSLLVLDANIPQATIAFLAENCTVPILAEPVSTIKAVRLLPVLDRLYMIKPNRLEAEVLSGIKISQDHDLERAADSLLEKGVEHSFISLGSEGVFYAGRKFRKKYANLPSRLVNTTGCGDAFMAACAWGLVQGFTLDQIARLGLAASAVCIEAPGAISLEMTAPYILKRAQI